MDQAITDVVTYDVDVAALALVREQCESLTADTTAGYKAVQEAIANLRTTRTKIEARRVEFKAGALEFGRLVDSEAKRYTQLVADIEEPLRVKKAVVDAEKVRVKAEAEAEKRRVIEAALKAEQDQREAELRVQREAEEQRLAAERVRLEAEWVEQDRIRLEQQAQADLIREAQAAIDAERQRFAAEQAAAKQIEFDRVARAQAESDAIVKAEQDRLAALERQAKIKALLPDVDKMREFADKIHALGQVEVGIKSGRMAVVLSNVQTTLIAEANRLRLYLIEITK